VIILREATPIAPAIEGLVLIWAASDAEEWINRLAWDSSLNNPPNCPPRGVLLALKSNFTAKLLYL